MISLIVQLSVVKLAVLPRFASARIIVNLGYKLFYRVLAIADDMTRHTPRDGYEFTVNNQHAMVVTLDEVLDNGSFAGSA